MVNQPLAHDGYCFEPPVWVRWKAGDGVAVVHAPAIHAAKVLAQVAPAQRRGRPHVCVAIRVGIVVVHAKQKRVYGLPRKAQGCYRNKGADGVYFGRVFAIVLTGAQSADKRVVLKRQPNATKIGICCFALNG